MTIEESDDLLLQNDCDCFKISCIGCGYHNTDSRKIGNKLGCNFYEINRGYDAFISSYEQKKRILLKKKYKNLSVALS